MRYDEVEPPESEPRPKAIASGESILSRTSGAKQVSIGWFLLHKSHELHDSMKCRGRHAFFHGAKRQVSRSVEVAPMACMQIHGGVMTVNIDA
jgi:hypothetical protein